MAATGVETQEEVVERVVAEVLMETAEETRAEVERMEAATERGVEDTEADVWEVVGRAEEMEREESEEVGTEVEATAEGERCPW